MMQAVQQPTNGDQVKKFRTTDTKRKCNHNDWDNVRAEKQFITLRCRECQRQHRIGPSDNWKIVDWKCHDFNTPEGCTNTQCNKYHVNHKKQTLEERARIHGLWVVNYVRLGKGGSEIEKKVKNLKKTLPTTGSKHLKEQPPPQLLTTPVDEVAVERSKVVCENTTETRVAQYRATNVTPSALLKCQLQNSFSVPVQQPVLIQTIQPQFFNLNPAAAPLMPQLVSLQQNIAVAPQFQIVNNNIPTGVAFATPGTTVYTPVWPAAR
eukprot:TRINITY_DN2912_c0_g2_i1.p1 TRINITY_DN2912_c0_g2~~TRINITY_DN2912_c0_g2_i1.p1  ORF type:complete len:282 (+),score=68.14 TRINITY_DN2912_c0_g2_i1:53-847(+)